MNIILYTKNRFFQEYNKYQQFGETNYSNFHYHNFLLIHCNGVSIGNLSKNVPNEPCSILIRAKGILKKVASPSQRSSYKAKFDGIENRKIIIKKKIQIKQKNKNNKLKKLKKRFGSEYSFTKFISDKQKRINQIMNKKKKV